LRHGKRKNEKKEVKTVDINENNNLNDKCMGRVDQGLGAKPT
jgi:hypothetical protein